MVLPEEVDIGAHGAPEFVRSREREGVELIGGLSWPSLADDDVAPHLPPDTEQLQVTRFSLHQRRLRPKGSRRAAPGCHPPPHVPYVAPED